MDFSAGAGTAKGALGANERAALMSNIKQQLELAHATEMLQQISDKCFKMCIQKPSSSLSSSDQVNIEYDFDSSILSYSFMELFCSQKLRNV